MDEIKKEPTNNFTPSSKKGGAGSTAAIVIIILIIILAGAYVWYKQTLKQEQARQELAEMQRQASLTPEGQTAEDERLQAELEASAEADLSSDMKALDGEF